MRVYGSPLVNILGTWNMVLGLSFDCLFKVTDNLLVTYYYYSSINLLAFYNECRFVIGYVCSVMDNR